MKTALKSAYLILTTLILLRTVSVSGELAQFLDFSSISIVLIPTILAFLVRKPDGICTGLKSAALVAVTSGLVGSLIGSILTLGHFDLDLAGLGAGLSVALLPVFYGLVIALLITPFAITTKH